MGGLSMNVQKMNFEQAVQMHDGQIWVKPMCDFFEIDVRNQHKKIKNDPILSNLVGKNTPVFGELDKNGRILLTKKGFLRWVQIINPNIIPKQRREQFIYFQSMVFDYLFGNMDEKEQKRMEYARLKKLKRVYGKIGNEINRLNQKIGKYLDNDLGQMQLPLNNVQIEE